MQKHLFQHIFLMEENHIIAQVHIYQAFAGGIPMSIMKNAIDSIQIGVEDFENGDERRNISAVRNIVAGILLLYKEKLCQLSPDESKELLIKKYIIPNKDADGKVFFVGKGKNTVDVQSIKERFGSLSIIVD
ncbi:hypothetical protein [Desulfovibrio falkowii]